jgi:Tfp pilus assembly protein PilO
MRRNLVIFAVAAVAAVVLFFFLAFTPQSRKIKDTQAQTQVQEQKAESLQNELTRLQALQKQAPQLREKAVKLDTALPSEPQLAEFILAVQDASNTSGIDWISISQSPPAGASGAGGVQEINISMSVAGGYFQVQDFLVRLETLSRAVKIGTISLSPGATAGGANALACSLSMKMFVSTQPPVASAVPAA